MSTFPVSIYELIVFSRLCIGTVPLPTETKHSTCVSGHRRRACCMANVAGLLAVAAPSWNLQVRTSTFKYSTFPPKQTLSKGNFRLRNSFWGISTQFPQNFTLKWLELWSKAHTFWGAETVFAEFSIPCTWEFCWWYTICRKTWPLVSWRPFYTHTNPMHVVCHSWWMVHHSLTVQAKAIDSPALKRKRGSGN